MDCLIRVLPTTIKKDLHGNDLVPLPQFQLLLNVVRLENPEASIKSKAKNKSTSP